MILMMILMENIYMYSIKLYENMWRMLWHTFQCIKKKYVQLVRPTVRETVLISYLLSIQKITGICIVEIINRNFNFQSNYLQK